MTEKQVYSLVRELRGDLYRAVLELGAQVCSTALLVVRRPTDLGASGRAALESLTPYLVEIKETSKWPGTTLFGHTATVYKYRTSANLVGTLQLSTDRLYSWRHPDLPEDLSFLRSDGTPWLVSIAHESDAYIEIMQEEAQAESFA